MQANTNFYPVYCFVAKVFENQTLLEKKKRCRFTTASAPFTLPNVVLVVLNTSGSSNDEQLHANHQSPSRVVVRYPHHTPLQWAE